MKKFLLIPLLLSFSTLLGCATDLPHETMPPEEEDPPVAEEGETAAITLETVESEEYGTYVTDGEGRALYLFAADTRGESSACHEDCAEAWPPLTTDGEIGLGPGLDAAFLDTISREDGSTQVTYGGWPLYYFQRDTGPGTTAGQDVHGYGGEWYLVSPRGMEVHGEGERAEEHEGRS